MEAALRRWIAHRTRDEALESLWAVRIPVSPVNTARDVLDDPHMRYRHALRSVDDADGPAQVPAPAPRLLADTHPAPVRLPEPGEHTAEILREWSFRRQ